MKYINYRNEDGQSISVFSESKEALMPFTIGGYEIYDLPGPEQIGQDLGYFLVTGQKIQLIKEIRQHLAPYFGLKQAKDLADNLLEQIGEREMGWELMGLVTEFKETLLDAKQIKNAAATTPFWDRISEHVDLAVANLASGLASQIIKVIKNKAGYYD